MGGFLSSHNSDDYSDDSSYSEEEEEIPDNSTKMELTSEHVQNQVFIVDEPDNCFDSATDTMVSSATHLSITPIAVTLDDILSIEEHLDLYEKVSLVYLLYDNSQLASQDLTKLLNEGNEKLLYRWAMHQKEISSTWQEKFIEALCIIQNYQILKRLGFRRKDLDERFLPHYMFTNVHVNKIRKVLYLLCEDLTKLETQKIIDLVYADFIRKNLEFKMFKPTYLELFFLYWETVGYITQSNLSNLCSILKQMEYFDMVDKLKQVISPAKRVNTSNNQRIEKIEKNRLLMNIDSKTVDANRKSESIFQGILSETSLEDLKSLESLDTAITANDYNKYKIDPKNPGVCLIINQENFYKEIDPNYKHLLPPSEKMLECRLGTQKDKEDLEATFNMFNFRTEVVDDLTHSDIIEKIRKTVQSVTVESSLFVCIMSHGDEGVIYGVNSCRVKVRAIQNLMCSENRKNLSGKPKVLILQSCQGTRCQKISCDDEDITTDSPSTSNKQKGVPEIVDLFTFWATVPGYGAIRNKKTGSWFIQSLCEKMKELGNKDHFEDICTAVIHDVSNKKWIKQKEDVAMVPLKETTFRHRFYLPPLFN